MSKDNVYAFTNRGPSKDILEKVLSEDFEYVLVIGTHRGEDSWSLKSNMANETAVYHMELAKKAILGD